jgi:hypothetical protein
MSLLDEIKQGSRAEFHAATGVGIAELRSLDVPEDVLAFYRNSEPAKIAEVGKAFVSETLNIEPLCRPFDFGNAGDVPQP